MNPELYQRVVAARPEAAVPSLVHYTGDELHDRTMLLLAVLRAKRNT